MCTRAWIWRGETFDSVSTRGELRTALGTEPVYQDAEWPDRSDDDCLCGCEVEKTAALAGYTAGLDDFSDWELTPNPSTRSPR